MQNPLQIFKYCPKCGSSGFAADSEKSILCNTCGFRYFVNMSAAVAAIIKNNEGEMLFTIRKYDPAAGMLDLPGGFVDLGETAENALQREIWEELHLKITDFQFIGTFPNEYNFGELKYHTLDLVFECETDSFTGLSVADDVSGFIFRKPQNVKSEEIGLDSIKLILDQLKKT